MKKIIPLIILLITGFSNSHGNEKTLIHQCPKAQRVIYQNLPNFYKVTDKLYRGAQPKGNGMKYLEKIGVKSVVNLRLLHDDRKLLKNTSLKYYRIRMSAWNPKEKEIVKFLKYVNNQNNTPLFLHCKHGSDRTGTMIAFYRIIFCGWSKDKAIHEMTKGGFGYHKVWKNLITFIRDIDINRLKKKAGIY
ncbi:MAG: tyrosine-protein phosphatase [Spirochaetota bacterium]|nr:tyrosine-protein phosphatase [Spirochaetota bacterium]